MITITQNGITFENKHIPSDVLIKIFKFLTPTDFKNLLRVSKGCFVLLSRTENLRRLCPFRVGLFEATCFLEVDHLFARIYRIVENRILLFHKDELKRMHVKARTKSHFLRDPLEKYPLQIEMEDVLFCALHHFPKGSWLDTSSSTLNALRSSRRIHTVIESQFTERVVVRTFSSEEAMQSFTAQLDLGKRISWSWE